jgi:hypothetical protein
MILIQGLSQILRLIEERDFSSPFTRPKRKIAMTQFKATDQATDQNKSSHAESHYWAELKRAISDTSGFKRWLLECELESRGQDVTQDNMVQLYLRQTLETLAY